MFVAFRVKGGRDDDLITWLAGLGEGDRSYYIREALRQGLFRQTPAPAYPVMKIEAIEVQDKKQKVNEVDLEAALEAWNG